ncbi:unnamed protein product [Medioppia subpectinata]|uniref:GPI mannosyltransferase 2 n=1 Tax=Medioppia subpectinata TaxID=1979941 RepID=A0A7R9KNM7_9ACAR|nr:unnamed protein product [Medioppia subpectinata]CAG2106571.1 unnamed protein product [Medioppia subpectinata]
MALPCDESVSVIKVSAKSRLVLLSLQLVANGLIPDHESADAFVHRLEDKLPTTGTDRLIYHVFSGLNRWDSQYYTTIAYNGYDREEFLAFFPLFPLLVRQLATILWSIQHLSTDRTFVSYYSLILLSSFALNFGLFILTALVLYKLTAKLFADRSMAANVVHWFSYNPSSVFFSSSYSESLFAFLTFSGIYLTHLSDKSHHLMMASALFGLSSATRSNGIISIGFVLYKQLNRILNECFAENGRFVLKKNWCQRLAINLLLSISLVIICLLPFISYQLYAYQLYCRDSDHPKVWCGHSIPLSYSYVQSQYWNVGFLQYYHLRQIPNFLLAFPIIVLNLKTCVTYLLLNSHRIVSIVCRRPQQRHKKCDSVLKNDMCFVHIIHTLCLTMFCVLFVHIQVTTRMLMSCTPLVYWAVESVEVKRRKRVNDLIHLWFYGYFIIGTILHSNFLPFT